MQEEKPQQSLWTYDFTVITLGSVVSMVGGALTGFGLSIMVLDYTGSTFLYVLSNVCYQLPMIVMPLVAGPYLDRRSRKKVIYRLDFLSSALFLTLFLLLSAGWFSYPVLLAVCLLMGSMDGVYMVAYDSFYPNLVTEGNLSKAYSVSSMLWPVAAMSQPLAALLYDRMGTVTPLFAINTVCFFVAACFERNIRHEETHMDKAPPLDGTSPLRQFGRDFKEGMRYIRGERGLLAVALYFTVSRFSSGSFQLQLPFFRNHAELFAAWPLAVVTLYTVVTNFTVVGQAVGGALQYRFKLPAEKKMTIALAIYTFGCISMAGELYLPIPLMAVTFFMDGLVGVVSYNIRVAGTQTYVPDGVRARFNGTFSMLTSLGGVAGSLAAGALAEVLSERRVALLMGAVQLLGVYLFMFRGRKDVAAIYNQDV